jgi:hypothetical protein
VYRTSVIMHVDKMLNVPLTSGDPRQAMVLLDAADSNGSHVIQTSVEDGQGGGSD